MKRRLSPDGEQPATIRAFGFCPSEKAPRAVTGPLKDSNWPEPTRRLHRFDYAVHRPQDAKDPRLQVPPPLRPRVAATICHRHGGIANAARHDATLFVQSPDEAMPRQAQPAPPPSGTDCNDAVPPFVAGKTFVESR